jgi:exopolysaccharide biosynthesis WecB/TagA/CpsF family protein
MSKARFLDVDFSIGSNEAILTLLEGIVYRPCIGSTVVMHVNLNTLFTCTKVPRLKAALDQSDTLVLFEGIGLKLAKLMTTLIWWPDVNGTDLVPSFLNIHPDRLLRLALVGGRPGISDTAGRVIAKQFPNIIVVKTLNGFTDLSDERTAFTSIRAAHPDILLLGLGTPLQEMTGAAWTSLASIPLIWCVGGLFDRWAGVYQRPPTWILECRLEWLWRLALQPSLYWRRTFIQGPWLLRKIVTIWRGSA